MAAKANTREILKKLMLHRVMAKGVLSKAAMVHLFHSIVSEHGDSHAKAKTTLTDILDAINKDMEPYSFQIRAGRSEVTGKLFYCFVNKKDDIAAKLSKPAREDWQLAVFRQLVSKIVNSEDGTAALTDVHAAKQEVDCLKTIKTADLDAEVNALMRQGWITSANDSKLTLGPRGYAEMRDDLHDKVPTCSVCKRPVVYGEGMDDEKRQHFACKDASGEAQDDAFTLADIEAGRGGLKDLLATGATEMLTGVASSAGDASGLKRRRRTLDTSAKAARAPPAKRRVDKILESDSEDLPEESHIPALPGDEEDDYEVRPARRPPTKRS